MPPARHVDLWPGWNQDQLEDPFWGLTLALDHFERCPRSAKALIKRFVVEEAKIAIVMEDEDDVMHHRLELVNPQTGKTGLDRTFNERNIAAARVALRGPLADEVYHYDLDDQQDIVTAPSRLNVWRLSKLARPSSAPPSRLGSI